LLKVATLHKVEVIQHADPDNTKEHVAPAE